MLLLSLGELGSAACGFEAVLLSLLHSGVAGQEPGGLQIGAVLGVHLQQGAADAVAQGAGLAGNAAAGNGGHDVNLVHGGGGHQRLTGDKLQGLQAEILVDVTAVDGDSAGAAGEQMNPGHGGLPATSAVMIGLLALIHSLVPP